MSDNIFIKSKGGYSDHSFKNVFDFETSVNYSPLPNTLHIQNKIDGNIQNYSIKDMLTSEIPQNESEIDESLLKLFGGANNEYADDTEALQNKLHTLLDNNLTGGVRKGSRTYVSRDNSESLYGGKEAPAGFVAHRKLVAHVQEKSGFKGGPQMQVFASMYKDQAKEENPGLDSVSLAEKAIKLFDADSEDERKTKYSKAKDILAEKKEANKEKRAAKKEKKAAKKAKKEALESSDTISLSDELDSSSDEPVNNISDEPINNISDEPVLEETSEPMTFSDSSTFMKNAAISSSTGLSETSIMQTMTDSFMDSTTSIDNMSDDSY